MTASLMAHLKIFSVSEAGTPSNNFHLLRYLLALLVLYSHSFGLLGLPEPGLFVFTFGAIAVKCFFAISGYLIALSCERTSKLSSFTWNRALRILPALLVALVASHYVGRYYNFFINNPVPYIVNGPVWTLSWEILCYCLCGLLWWLGLLTVSSLGAIVVTSWMLYIILPNSGDTANIIAPLLMLFSLGAFIALNKKNINLSVAGPISLLLITLFCLDPNATVLSWIFNNIPFLYGPNFTILKYQLLILLFSLPFALIWLAYSKPVIRLHNDYSYGMYILGWPVQQVIIANVNQAPHPISLFFTTWAITHLLAMLSWHLLEKRVLQFKR